MRKTEPEERGLGEFIAFSEKVAKEVPNRSLLDSLECDPRWREERPIHVATLGAAFAGAILMADNWEDDKYLVPSGFDGMINWVTFMARKEIGRTVGSLSIAGAGDMMMRLAREHPQYREWAERVDPEAVRCNILEFLWDRARAGGGGRRDAEANADEGDGGPDG